MNRKQQGRAGGNSRSRRGVQAAEEQTTGSSTMVDNKSNRGGGDRKRVAGDQGYELGYFARKHGISRDEARKLIERVGNDRDKLNAAAQKLK
jgi:hypothetical protein